MSRREPPEPSTNGELLVDLPRPTEGRRDYLDDLLALLWPHASISSAQRLAGTRTGTREYLLLPSAARPTVCVPTRPRRGAALVIRDYKVTGGRRTTYQLRALSLAARVGLLDLWPHRLRMSAAPSGDSIESYLETALGGSLAVTVYTSPPRANRKPVLRVLTAAGEGLGFAKLGVNPLTSDLVTAEGDALAQLARHPLTTVVVPSLLHRGRWHDIDVVVQGAVVSPAPQPAGPQLLQRAMREVAEVLGTTQTRLEDSAHVRALRTRLLAAADTPPRSALLTALQAAVESSTASAVDLVHGSWHGDWTPWNMTSDGTRAYVWDWERFASGVPVGYDALHFALQTEIVRDRAHPRLAVHHLIERAASLLEPYDVAGRAIPHTVLLYLAELGTRYHLDGQAEAGARLGDLEAWLLPEVRSLSASLREAGP